MSVVNTTKTDTSAKRSNHAAPAAAGPALPLIVIRYKTKTCKAFTKTGSCPYGVRCMFAHGEADGRTKEKNVADDLLTEGAIRFHHRRLKFEATRAKAATVANKEHIQGQGDNEVAATTPSATSPTSCDPRTVVVSVVPRQFPSNSHHLFAVGGSSRIRTESYDSTSSMNWSSNSSGTTCGASNPETYYSHPDNHHHQYYQTPEEDVSLYYPTSNSHCYNEAESSHVTPFNATERHTSNVRGALRSVDCSQNHFFSATSNPTNQDSPSVIVSSPHRRVEQDVAAAPRDKRINNDGSWYRHDPYSITCAFAYSPRPPHQFR